MSVEFLEAIHPEGHLAELRMIRNGEVRQEFFDTHSSLLIKSALEHDAEGWDCYIGALPRVRASGKAEDCTPTTTALWADLDTKNLGGGHMAAFLSLQKAGLEPSILVDSGNGLHAWWLLRQPVLFTKASAAMQGLHKQIGSDHVHDAPRVMRLPGTRNHKACDQRNHTGVGMVCKPVRLLKLEPDRRYRWQDFTDFIEPPMSHAVHTGYETERQEYHELPPWLRADIEKGAPRGQRSELIWKVVCNLLERGWEEDEIEALMSVMPVGEKVQEMRDRAAHRYMMRTITRAREVIE